MLPVALIVRLALVEPDPNPKNSHERPKKHKRPKIWPNSKRKDMAVLPKQKLIV